MKKFFSILVFTLFAQTITPQKISLQHKHPNALPCMHKGCYVNHPGENKYKHLADAVRIGWATVTSSAKNYKPENITSWSVNTPPLARSITPTMQWVGHATVLIQLGGLNILTDPVLCNKLRYFGIATYTRSCPPGIALESLPRIDIILISHCHRDHVDEATLKALAKKQNTQPLVLVPVGNKKLFQSYGFKNIQELTWWEQKQINTRNGSCSCTFVPTVHWANRGAFDINKSLWGSWVVQHNGFTLYFGGDSAYAPHCCAEIKKEFPRIDIALLPIGPCEPRHLMCHSHMSPQEASQAFLALGAHTFVPIHFGTFRLGPDNMLAPLEMLQTWWGEHTVQLQHKKLRVLRFGERLTL